MSGLKLSTFGPHVRVLTIDRPEVRNALSRQLLGDLHSQLSALAGDTECRALVLTGAGHCFSAGLDLRDESLVGDPKNPEYVPVAVQTQNAFAELVLTIRRFPRPVIAAVEGPAVGAGMALATCCDLRVGGPSTSFDSKVLRAGLAGCDLGMSWLLPRMVGVTVAFDILLGGRRLESEEAHTTGLLSRLAEEDIRVLPEALEIGSEIATLDPFNVQLTKEVLWAQLEVSSLSAGIALENRTQVLASTRGSFWDRAQTFSIAPDDGS
jgi:enoyl-CoA hydratase